MDDRPSHTLLTFTTPTALVLTTYILVILFFFFFFFCSINRSIYASLCMYVCMSARLPALREVTAHDYGIERSIA